MNLLGYKVSRLSKQSELETLHKSFGAFKVVKDFDTFQ